MTLTDKNFVHDLNSDCLSGLRQVLAENSMHFLIERSALFNQPWSSTVGFQVSHYLLQVHFVAFLDALGAKKLSFNGQLRRRNSLSHGFIQKEQELGQFAKT